MNVLLVSAGRRVELVDLFRTASRGGRVVAVDIDPLAPALYRADAAEAVPRVEEAGFIERLLELCGRHQIGLVAATTDRELVILAESAGRFEAQGARVAVGAAPAVRTALDKLACSRALAEQMIDVVPTEPWRAGESSPFGHPVVVKPKGGAAAEGVRTISAAAQWTDPPAGDEWLVQPLIDAPEITIDALASDPGRIVSLGARRRLKVRGGEVERAVTVHGEPFVELAGRIAVALALSGPFNFQIFIPEDGPPLVGELNPRLGGGLPLSEHAGAGLLDALCAWARDGDWPDGPTRIARAGASMTRHDSSIFLEGDELLW
ncbi:MAG TPA: ATP-grasp domain-containing protein [Solirubrobacteraceae bacterium]|nr:ATP-grasp domain-containing protein [Solirubrobacteraceae bacterium]